MNELAKYLRLELSSVDEAVSRVQACIDKVSPGDFAFVLLTTYENQLFLYKGKRDGLRFALNLIERESRDAA